MRSFSSYLVFFRNKRGFTLVEMMVVAGLAGVSGLAMMKTNEMAMKTNIATQVGLSWQTKRMEIQNALSSNVGCGYSLVNAQYGTIQDGPHIDDIINKYNKTVAVAGTSYPANSAEYEITTLTLVDTTGGIGPYGANTTAELQVLVTWKKDMAGKPKDSTTIFKFPVEISIVNAASPVTACSTNGGDNSEASAACTMFGGDLIDITGAGTYRCLNMDAYQGAGAVTQYNVCLGSGSCALQTTPNSFETAIGFSALANSNGVNANTAVGNYALGDLISGSNNVGIGWYAGNALPAGPHHRNTLIGGYAAYSKTSSTDNTAVGYGTMGANNNGTAGTANTALGYQALKDLGTGAPGGSHNTAIGSNAAQRIADGNYNTVIGQEAMLHAQTNDSANTVVGAGAGVGDDAFPVKTNNTFIGGYSGIAISGDNNTALGYSALGLNLGEGNLACGDSALVGSGMAINSSYNVAIGTDSLYFVQTGSGYNTGLGYQAMKGNLTGQNNLAIGYNSMLNTGTAVQQISAAGYLSAGSLRNSATGAVAIGHQALAGGAGGDLLTAVGYQALASLNTAVGHYNTAIGAGTLKNMIDGASNTAIGPYALYNMTESSQNTAVGPYALYNNGLGAANTALGENALYNNTSASFNVSVGQNSGQLTQTGSGNTAIGSRALNKANNGSPNTAVGANSLFNTTSGTYNTALGTDTLMTNVGGNYNVAIGDHTSYYSVNSDSNTAIGNAALYSNVAGIENVVVGNDAAYENRSSWNTIIGASAFFNVGSGNADTDIQNTVIGAYALYTATASIGNVAVGANAMKLGSNAGSLNTCLGTQACLSATGSGMTENVAIGMDAGSNITGISNTFIGRGAGTALATGDNNTFIGDNSGLYQTSGSGNTYIGAEAGSAVGQTSGDNNVMIGFGALPKTLNGSNQFTLTIGNADLMNGYIDQADSGNNTVTLGGKTSIYYDGGYGNLTALSFPVPSDRRLKKNIRPYQGGLAKMMQLKVKNFKYINAPNPDITNVGVIAQEIREIMPDVVSENELKHLAITTNDVLFTLVSGVQEQQEMIAKNKEMFQLMQNQKSQRLEKQDRDIGQLKEANRELKRELASLRNMLRDN